MPAAIITVNLSVQWTPPGAALNSGNSSFQVQTTYNAQNVGQLDIPTTAQVGDILPVPFGSVAAAKTLIVKNMSSAEVGIRLNGSNTNNFNIPAGGEVAFSIPSTPANFPMASASVVLTATPTVIESILFFCFGD